MKDTFSKIPFAKILIPAIASTLVSNYLTQETYPAITAIVGIITVVLSHFIPLRWKHRLRWVGGAGLFTIVFALFSFLTIERISEAQPTLSNNDGYHITTVQTFPQEKNKSIAYTLKIEYPKKQKIIAYLEKGDEAASLTPGDEIIIHAHVEEFKNFGNPNDFDYKQYMRNKGFAGSTYIPTKSWIKTDRENTKSITNYSQHLRHQALKLYKSFNLSDDAYSFISALTLGYKDDLSTNLKEAFQASGTSHILAVSGLHVGIIYALLVFVFSVLGKTGKHKILEQLLIIASLWFYAVFTGLSPSVIRATIMLSSVSLIRAFKKNTYTTNILAIAAFSILAYNPLQLFDVGFQMSFTAVLAIVYINPIINRKLYFKNKLSSYIWSLFTVSLSAQIGVLPISLFYFGTFPTYFFIANMIIIPVIGVIIYLCVLLVFISMFSGFKLAVVGTIHEAVRVVLEFLINLVLKTVYLIETLPFAQISNLHLTLLQTIIAIIFIATIVIYLNRRLPKHLITALASLFIFVCSIIINLNSNKQDYIVVFNTVGRTDISLYIDNKKEYLDYNENGLIPHSSKNILLLSENRFNNLTPSSKMDMDIIILSKDRSFSMKKLNSIFNCNTIILDSTIPQYIKDKWIEECSSLDIEIHDVSKKGAFFIKI